jgi:hypothetical protein
MRLTIVRRAPPRCRPHCGTVDQNCDSVGPRLSRTGLRTRRLRIRLRCRPPLRHSVPPSVACKIKRQLRLNAANYKLPLAGVSSRFPALRHLATDPDGSFATSPDRASLRARAPRSHSRTNARIRARVKARPPRRTAASRCRTESTIRAWSRCTPAGAPPPESAATQAMDVAAPRGLVELP